MVACHYGRIQSALLDRESLIVAYDRARGEPRAKGRERQATVAGGAEGGSGDCIDCGACVLTCPTGIDIRDGLQMECIHCTQCADACDEIMRKVHRPEGLIRYSSRAAMESGSTHRLRPRVILYPAALALTLGGFLVALASRQTAEVTILRGTGQPFSVAGDGRISNQLRVKIRNRSSTDRSFTIAIDDLGPGTMIAPQNPLPVSRGETATTSLFVLLPADSFSPGAGERIVTVSVTDDATFETHIAYPLVGPGREPGP
jgi:cytochrome c oxidase accessory protein FixG